MAHEEYFVAHTLIVNDNTPKLSTKRAEGPLTYISDQG